MKSPAAATRGNVPAVMANVELRSAIQEMSTAHYQPTITWCAETQGSRVLAFRITPQEAAGERAALVLYLASAESLVHQAAAELGRPELVALAADPSRPLPLTLPLTLRLA